MTAGRLFFSDRYGYRFCVAPQRNKKHDNQLNHTSHPLSDGVLTAACPMYYTCKYYNAYVEICLYIEKPPLYLLTKIGSEGRGPPAGGQFRRVSRGGTSSVVAAYTGLSHSFRALEAYTGYKLLMCKFVYIEKIPSPPLTRKGEVFLISAVYE